jgi:ribosomal protein S18 acetylase RimI-like enzyme
MSIDYETIDARRKAAADPVPITDEMKPRVQDTLAGAFNKDPVMNWFLRQDDLHDEVLHGLIGQMLQQYMDGGWAIAAADGSCATLWSRPGESAAGMGLLDQIAMLPRILRTCTLRRFPRALKVMNTLDENHPHEPDHYYLFMIGVSPDCQGLGLGSTILSRALETVDAARMPAYLENSNPKNMPLYERHGFKVLKEIRFEPDGPPLWPMWREARH